jgi:hypothetical protein
MENYANAGQGQGSSEPVDAYDKAHGKYKEQAPADNAAEAMPKAPDPSPFTLGNVGR